MTVFYCLAVTRFHFENIAMAVSHFILSLNKQLQMYKKNFDTHHHDEGDTNLHCCSLLSPFGDIFFFHFNRWTNCSLSAPVLLETNGLPLDFFLVNSFFFLKKKWHFVEIFRKIANKRNDFFRIFETLPYLYDSWPV